MATIIKIPISTREKNPKLRLTLLYNRYNEITEEHCIGLIKYLYSGVKDDWINPLTTRPLKKSSDIIISFLSKCYYEWGDNRLEIDTPGWKVDLTYKEHIRKFIPVEYLFDIPLFKQHSNISPQGMSSTPTTPLRIMKSSSSSSSSRSRQPPPPVMRRSPSFNSPQGAATNAHRIRGRSSSSSQERSISPPRARNGRPSPQGAATNAPQIRARSLSSTSIKSIYSPRARKISSSSSSSRSRQPPSPLPKRRSPLFNSPQGAARNPHRSISRSPKRSKSPLPKRRSNSKPATITKKITFSMKSSDMIIAKTMLNANQLKESDCINLLNEMKNKMRNKTSRQILDIKLTNPITTPITMKEIGIDSPLIKSYLIKCYYEFDNPTIKKDIDELVNIKSLDNFKDFADKKAKEEEEEERLKQEKEKEEERLKQEKEKEEYVKRRPIIEKFIEDRINVFSILCKQIMDNCDKNGILRNHKLISLLVEAIMIIIYTKYLHLNVLYDDFDVNMLKTPLKIYMYDDEFNDYYTSKQLHAGIEFKNKYDSNKIIYQKVNLTQSLDNNLIDMFPKTIDTYYLNTLYNRQYVFELVNLYDDGNFNNPTMRYNKINNIDNYAKSFKYSVFPYTLLFANNVNTFEKFNYDITNSVLPKYIFYDDPSMTGYFTDIIELINTKLKTLPTIKGFVNEVSIRDRDYYEGVLKDMKDNSFGNNDTEYGHDDMIRKNILFSLNAQNPLYILKNLKEVYYETYYNTKFTGTFPLFTWIPLNPSIQDTNYNFPNYNNWQPLGLIQYSIKVIENAYKNDYTEPYSKWLNETIYKVITDVYASTNSLIIPQRIDAMRMRVIKTIGIYKDETISSTYDNKKIYLYHGTRNRLHNINGREKDIELLGFLSTSVNMYVASYYSGVGENNNGFIYIIEIDKTHTYINLLDNLYQILLLPNSIIRIIHEFNFGSIRVILCRLIRTPSVKQNNLLYNKLLDEGQTNKNFDKHISYNIAINNNAIPTCAYVIGNLWKEDVVNDSKYLELYTIQRKLLNNKRINNKHVMPPKVLKDDFVYFSLGQEYELYVERGMPLMLGSFADIKYSIHQHFIKDCYKGLDIPCIDYIFVNGTQKASVRGVKAAFVKNSIATGILLSDYKQNRINQYKYDVNNFFIDCIFKFNSFNNDNKKLTLPTAQDDDILDDAIYADKIEGFRDAGLYLNGEHNPLFNSDVGIGECIQYLRNWKQLFTKYDEASDEKLGEHFKWCNDRIVKLIEIIKATKEHYLKFIKDTLKHKIDTSSDAEVIVAVNKERLQLKHMIEDLTNTLLKRAEFYSKCTNDAGGSQSIKHLIEVIRVSLREAHVNTHNSKLYKAPLLTDLMFKEGVLRGGLLSMKQIEKLKTRIIPDPKPNEHLKTYEAFKNVPIQEAKDMRKYADMPKTFKKYYRGSSGSKNKYIDISNHCYYRFV
jgi:hypothetical protein